MIDRPALLADLRRLVVALQDDLRARSTAADVPDLGRRLADEYARASAARRTAATFEAWREGEITQMAVAWVLSCVFARFLEDNALVEAPRIAGPAGDRLEDARDARLAFFRSHPTETDREHFLDLFTALAALPGGAIFGPVNPIRWLPTWLSPEAATSLVTFFQTIDSTSGLLVHDFTDPAWDTRFLGDLYQDLSEAARKRFALLGPQRRRPLRPTLIRTTTSRTHRPRSAPTPHRLLVPSITIDRHIAPHPSLGHLPCQSHLRHSRSPTRSNCSRIESRNKRSCGEFSLRHRGFKTTPSGW
jgi:hypothetical protein